ncbi:MAG: TIGR00300 family protein [Candidatus Pacebacteria bacterium]|jgi:lysine-ketoglutarate reductase/saccharopine dehydrogenase-like protein (TIGR00300 family)|nr:TIGR00300 family protein [Candidatus Paceibacterota bacterium]|tara:strand:- start:1752 stop:2768 length:1017 start_codon:yes stop_codon:yes gene_type:complete
MLDCEIKPAPNNGVLPDLFYSTSHLPTQVRVKGEWVDVENIEMDLAIRIEYNPLRAMAIPMASAKAWDNIVVGHEGIKISPLTKPKEHDVFSFMGSEISSERPNKHIIHEIAEKMKLIRNNRHDCSDKDLGTKVLLVGGPAIVHSGGREALSWMIDEGYIHVLFSGNALPTHDMEVSLYGTSLGFRLDDGVIVPHGHQHHLYAINKVRGAGSIKNAVESGLIKDGIMASCIRHNVDIVLGGSIRDDGPLPDVETDMIKAQWAMREALPGVGLVLMVATTLHSIATGNCLPAKIPSVCVDINSAVPTKLADRGSFQAVGLVMDASSFVKELARELSWEG